MNKKILLISLSTIYIGFMVFAFLLGGIFENWLILDARTLYRGTLLIVPFLIYLVWKKIFTVSVVDRLSPFVFFAMWIVLLLFNKSLINALL